MVERIHLEIISVLEREGSLTRAGEVLGLSQSALTHSIKKLEDLSGSRIWEKRGRGLELTAAGRELAAAAGLILPRLNSLDRSLKEFGSGTRGHLRIGVECHPCFEWLMSLISSFLNDWPDVELDVLRDLEFQGLDRLEAYEIDLLVTPDHIPWQGLVYLPVFSFEMQLVLAQDHPLSLKPWVEPEDLKDQVLLSYPIPQERLDVFTHFLGPAGIKPGKLQQVEAVEVMVQLAAAGRGVTTFPDWLAKRYAEELPVQGIRLGEAGLKKDLYLVHRERDAGVRHLRDFLERACVQGCGD